jgi:chloramphenicol-sensitive protein RarD
MSPRAGFFTAVAAFFLWGVLPLYWKQLAFLDPLVIVAQRALWSWLMLVPLLAWSGAWRPVRAALRQPRQAVWHLVSGLLLSANWLLYVWATLNGRIVEGSLGYYLNPFFNMLFGTLWFGDRHSRAQLAAIGTALAGVLLQVPAVGGVPWVALTLAVTFSLYAVVRKRAPLGSLAGLSVETSLMLPLAVGWLWLGPVPLGAAFGGGGVPTLWVIGTGLATMLPLVCFGHAARNLRLTTLGVLQFLGPTLQFLIGWLVYGEPMPAVRLASFALIWLAVAVYAADTLRRPAK